MTKHQDARARWRHRREAPAGDPNATLEKWKSIASIASAVAVPIVLALGGYLIQRQLADESLKKDYVSIAASILKENPSGQEPDLRKWAVTVLDANSSIPFSDKAKVSLERGVPLVLPGPAIPPPPEACMEPAKERKVNAAIARLEANVSGVVKRKEDIKVVLDHFMTFVDVVTKEEFNAGAAVASLTCMQKWASLITQGDDEYRASIGAPDSKTVYAKIKAEREAAAAPTKATSAPLQIDKRPTESP